MIYLNNTATSYPKPSSVVNCIGDYLSNPPTNFGRNTNSTSKSIISDIRSSVLSFFEANDDYNIVFTSGSTESINMAIFGSNLIDGEVIISSAEHNSVIRSLMELKNRGKIELKIAQCNYNGSLDINSVQELLTNKTKMIVINHISNVTGNILDVKEISKLAKQNNILLLIDGSQSSGNIPINLNEINPDFFAFTSHKSLFGLQGSGGLIIRKDSQLGTFKYGGTGFKSNMLTQPEEFPHKYEAGTQNIPGILSLAKGIEFINEIGINNIIEHKKKLMLQIINEFEKNNNIKMYYDKNNYSWSVLSFNIGNLSPDEVSYILKGGYDIEVRAGVHCAPLIHHNIGTDPMGTVRVSPSIFTTEEEVAVLIEAVKLIASELV